MPKTDEIIARNVILWIYSSRNGSLKKFNNVNIHQRVTPYNHRPIDQYCALSEEGVDRLVSGMEYAVWYFPRKYEYLIWSSDNNEKRIRNILMNTLKQRSREKIKECLSIMKKEHDILEIAHINLVTNCVVSIKNYDQLKETINQYFYNL